MILGDLLGRWRSEANLFRRRGHPCLAELVESPAQELTHISSILPRVLASIETGTSASRELRDGDGTGEGAPESRSRSWGTRARRELAEDRKRRSGASRSENDPRGCPQTAMGGRVQVIGRRLFELVAALSDRPSWPPRSPSGPLVDKPEPDGGPRPRSEDPPVRESDGRARGQRRS